MKKWTKIARTGTFTSMSGTQVTITPEKLDELVQSYSLEMYKPPLVKGHPKTEDPAFGHVSALKCENDILFAQFACVPDKVKKEVYDGRYLSKSISVFPPKEGEPWKLKHVGLLGAAPPAIDGLGGIHLSEGEDGELCFATLTNDTSGGSQMDEKDKKIAELEAQLKTEQGAKTEAEAAREKEAQARTEAEGKLAKSTEEQATAARTAKIEKLITDGKVLPAEKEQIAEFAKALEGSEEIAFSAGEGKKPLKDHFFTWLEGRKEHGLFEFAAPDVTTSQDSGAVDTSGLAEKF